VLLGVVLVLAIAVALFDWNWFRRPLERHLGDRSNREVRIGDLHVDIGFSLEPTVRLRALYVENAPWADKRPTITAGEASVTFSLKSVWEGRPVISRMVLVDADVDLERQADGRRNWRLRSPEYLGPGRVKVLRLEPVRTKIRFVHRGIALDVLAASSAAEDASHPTRIAFEGILDGVKFSGKVLTGALLTFVDTNESFALRGHASAGASRLEADGSIADLFKPSAIDAKVRLAGPSLSTLHPFFRPSLPATRPYALSSSLLLARDVYSFTELRGKIGTSDLAGKFSVDRSKERLMLRAALRSESAELSDFRPRAGTGSVESGTQGAPQRLFSGLAFNGERLNAFDAHVTLDARRLHAVETPALDSLRVTANLDNGVLALQPIDIGLAGGHLAGSISFDAQRSPAVSHVKMDLRELRLEKLLEGLPQGAKAGGPVGGRVEMKGQGDSVASIAGSSSGIAEVTMQGGDISNLLDAKLALNGGKILRLMFTGDGAIGINSALVSFDFAKGLGKSTAIVLDTEQTHTQGTGVLDLRNETFDVLLTPQPKKPGIFPLGASIRAHGPLREPTFSLIAKEKGLASLPSP
jgi:hypothetical protein